MEPIRKSIYIQHEINSLKNPKIIQLLQKHKVDGFGVYWLLLEYLQGTETGTIQEEQIETIAPLWLQSDVKKAFEIVKTCLSIKLLEKDEQGGIYSPMLEQQREEMKQAREQKSKAGKKGAEAKKQKDLQATGIETKEADPTAEEKETLKTLRDKICQKFGVNRYDLYYPKISQLLESLSPNGDTSLGVKIILEGLKRLDEAEAITSGRVPFTINSFLNPETFLKLYYGEYDELY